MALPIVLLAAVTLCVACGSEEPIRRLEVDRMVGEAGDSAHPLRIAGHGFPIGHHASVEFVGVVRRPGTAHRSMRVTVDAEARSAFEIGFPPASLERLADWSPGRFEGRVRVWMPGRRGQAPSSGHLESVRLELGRNDPMALRRRLDLEHEARRWLMALGISNVRPTMGERGIEVLGLEKNSLAVQAGIRLGDRIQKVDGAAAIQLVDLLPGPGSIHPEITLARAPSEQRLLRLPSMAAIAAPEGPDWLRVSLFVPLVALCVAAWNWRRGRWGLGQLRASRLWPALPWMLVLAVATPWIAERALHWVLALWSLPWLLWAILPRGVASRRSSLARLVQFLGSFAALGLAAWLTDGWAIAAGGLTGGPGAWVWDWPLFASPRSWGCLLVLWLTSRWPLTAGGVPPGRLLRHVHLSLEEASTEGIRWHRLQRVAGVGEAGSAWAIVMIFGCGPLLPFELLGFFQRAALPMGVSLTGCVLLKTLVVWALMQIAPRLSLPNMHMGMWVGALIAATLALLVLVAPHRPDITLTLSGLVGITLGLVWRAWLDRQHIGVGTESSGFSPFLGAPKRG